jgi:hypothetical protein
MKPSDLYNQMELADYKKFVEEEFAVALTDLLKSHHIEYVLTTDRESLDSLYGDKLHKQEYFVKIRRIDFSRADAILHELGKSQLANVDPDHYLFSFTDEELGDVLIKQDEWNEFDVQLARKILGERGYDLSDEKISHLKRERVIELAKPEKTSWFWILLGYFSSFFGRVVRHSDRLAYPVI